MSVAARRVGESSFVVVGSPALVSGFVSHRIIAALAEHVPGGLEGLVAAQTSPIARVELEHGINALTDAAGTFERLPRGGSDSGSAVGHPGHASAPSKVWIPTSAAASLLERSVERARQLANEGTLSSRINRGRLEFIESEVVAHAEVLRRKQPPRQRREPNAA